MDHAINEPLAFIVDQQLAVLVLLANSETTELTKMGLMVDGKFSLEAVTENLQTLFEVMEEEYGSPFNEAFDTLYHHVPLVGYLYSTDVTIGHFGEDGTVARSEEQKEGTLLYISCEKDISPFQRAYASVNEFIEEIKEKLSFVKLPDNFDWLGHVVTIQGTFWG